MTRSLLPLLLLVLLSLPGQAAPVDGFPPDPPSVRVQDRFFETIEFGGKSWEMYGVLYRVVGKGPRGPKTEYDRLDLYSGTGSEKGMEWKRLHRWTVLSGPDAVQVVQVNAGEEDVQFSLQSWFKYVEGRAIPVLHWNPRTGTFTEHFAD